MNNGGKKQMEKWSHPPERRGNTTGSHRNRCCRRICVVRPSGGSTAALAVFVPRNDDEKARPHAEAGFFVRPWSVHQVPVTEGPIHAGPVGWVEPLRNPPWVFRQARPVMKTHRGVPQDGPVMGFSSAQPILRAQAGTLPRGRKAGTGRCPPPGKQALRPGHQRHGDGIRGFPWNMPTGLLFFTTRSPRFAAFLAGTRKPQVQHP
jgi:hypothetical protein